MDYHYSKHILTLDNMPDCREARNPLNFFREDQFKYLRCRKVPISKLKFFFAEFNLNPSIEILSKLLFVFSFVEFCGKADLLFGKVDVFEMRPLYSFTDSI